MYLRLASVCIRAEYVIRLWAFYLYIYPAMFRVTKGTSARWLSALLLMSVAAVLHAQPGLRQMPFTWAYQSAFPLQTVKVQRPDVDSLLRVDTAEALLGLPFRFGYAMPVDLTPENSGEWQYTPTGERIWRLKVEAPGAVSLNLNFAEFELPEGCRLWVYDASRQHLLGAFTHRNNNHHRNFATAPVVTDHLILELYIPSSVQKQPVLRLAEVVYGYKDGGWEKAGFGQSGSCNVNINCPEAAGWEDERQAVVMLLTSGNVRKCTGTMINNTAGDGTPYLLTARHCNTLNNAIFMFNYQSENCTPADGPTDKVLQGCDILSQNANSDFTLLRLTQAPPAHFHTYFAGWTRDSLPSPLSYCIHHPNGDVKKFSVDSDAVAPSPYLSTPLPGGTHWRVADWNLGTTEAGSSGSALMDTDHRIRGQLHGGFASCTNNLADFFGRFDVSWNFGADSSLRLKDWLDPLNTDTQQLDGGYFYAPYFNYDAEVTGIGGFTNPLCDSTVTPALNFVNWGLNTATSVEFIYALDDDTSSFTWTGSAVFGDTMTISMPTLSLPFNQDYTLSVWVYRMNGINDDEYPDNDTAHTLLTRAGGAPFAFSLHTDNFPGETSWLLLDEYSDTVFTSPVYTVADTIYTQEFCLRQSCYRLVLHDAAGNGLCCLNGNGSAILRDETGTPMDTITDFYYSRTISFCNPGFPDTADIFQVFPVPNDGSFSIIIDPRVLGEDVELRLSDLSGRIVFRQSFTASYIHTIDARPLATGVYAAYLYSAVLRRTGVCKILVVN